MQQLGFDETVLRQADLVVFRMAYPFSAFDPEFNYAENVRPVLWVFGWTDLNNDGVVSISELTWLNYGYQRGTATEVPVAKLSSKLTPSQRLVLRVDVRPVRPPYPSTVPVTIEVVAYKRTPAPRRPSDAYKLYVKTWPELQLHSARCRPSECGAHGL